MSARDPEELLGFWFDPETARRWFAAPNPALDAEIATRYAAHYEDARAGGLDFWGETPRGALALVIVLDQLPRHLFRDSGRAFEADAQSRAVAVRAVARGHDKSLAAIERRFLYMPFMHSEALADQERAVALFHAIDDAEGLKAAEEHRAVIARFGRFPYRNTALGRATTAEEQTYLDKGDWP
jgi:uncharacterized protein (DUF924 family)